MKTAVISGGNGGLGRALAGRLEAEGWHCVLMDVNTEGLEASETRTPVQVDLTDSEALNRAAASVVAERPSIDMVIYNAGVSQIGPFAESDEASHRRVFEINYFAAVAMARAFLKPLRESGGVHLAISSVAGFAPLKNRTAYAGSKHALEGFFGSLRSEELAHGVRCLIAAPSFVATNIGNTGREADGIVRPGSAADGVDYMSPEDAAAVILRGVARGRTFIPVGRVARLSWWIRRAAPGFYERMMRRRISGEG
ncbi:SDR family NAD(P)-dependent oxidoreductase [Roseovarius indicus]|uniref:Oxidoreductase SadH n=1 Tax=Roseovarius indicus TaxID=540747 RepID=A0A0T5PA23_9RHOB|nr:SDR family NAD(P)-dependent oxidoreductase [Roseovarius indicus]KRS18086.1 short-chain dehydrogenase [Roseovarius indicus]QEW27084.1 Putative oxidoreductase SadH [Roseovarius indicus]SFD54457.1 Short-chain dehydrogenase [Roseovarius indicus]